MRYKVWMRSVHEITAKNEKDARQKLARSICKMSSVVDFDFQDTEEIKKGRA